MPTWPSAESIDRTLTDITTPEYEVSEEKKEKLATDPADEKQAVSYNAANQVSINRKTYRQRTALITLAPNVRGTGFKQYWSRSFHTLRVFTFPAVWFAGLQWAAQDAWLTFYLTTEDDNWT